MLSFIQRKLTVSLLVLLTVSLVGFALLRLSGRQVGLQINADVSGLVINLRR